MLINTKKTASKSTTNKKVEAVIKVEEPKKVEAVKKVEEPKKEIKKDTKLNGIYEFLGF